MENYTGALLDTRTDEQKSKDFKLKDLGLAGASPVVWKEKAVSEWRNYPARNQISSSSCVSQAYSKALFTLGFDVVSAHPIYRTRRNFAEKGMWLYDGADILVKQGTVPEALDQSQNLDEIAMNRDLSIPVKDALAGNPIKIGGYAYVDHNIEAIAQAIEDHGL